MPRTSRMCHDSVILHCRIFPDVPHSPCALCPPLMCHVTLQTLSRIFKQETCSYNPQIKILWPLCAASDVSSDKHGSWSNGFDIIWGHNNIFCWRLCAPCANPVCHAAWMRRAHVIFHCKQLLYAQRPPSVLRPSPNVTRSVFQHIIGLPNFKIDFSLGFLNVSWCKWINDLRNILYRDGLHFCFSINHFVTFLTLALFKVAH